MGSDERRIPKEIQAYHRERALELRDIKAWKTGKPGDSPEKASHNPKTTAVLFGRFQPLHKGHVELIKRIEASGLDVHVIVNDKVDTEDERNPYSIEQRMEMFRRELGDDIKEGRVHIHEIDGVYLGRKGADVGEDVRRLKSFIKKQIVPQDRNLSRVVMFYAHKNEDQKHYLVDGIRTTEKVHYVDLLTDDSYDRSTRSEREGLRCMAKQPLIPIMIDGEIAHASVFRDKRNTQNWKSLLHPRVQTYVLSEEELAQRNGRTVGDEEKKKDDAETVDATYTKQPALTTGDFQKEMLIAGKRVIFQKGDGPARD